MAVKRAPLTALVVLVRAVTTVVRAVAHPVAGDAAVVPTLKLGGCAELVCKRHKKQGECLKHFVYYSYLR